MRGGEPSKRTRLIGLDLFRVFSVLMVFFFHTSHIDCHYSIFEGFVYSGAMFMTAFYMLSGFVLSYTYQQKNLCDFSELKKYMLKRVIGTVPIYYVIAIIYTVYAVICLNLGVIEALALIPIETLGLQTVFCSLFNISHNGGTWFISCLLFCYAVFPLLQLIIKNIGLKAKIIIFLLITVVLLYVPIAVWVFDLDSIYSNPFFRICEFALGVLLFGIWGEIKDKVIYKKIIAKWITALIVTVLLIVGVIIAWELGIAPGNYMLYSWIGIPGFALLILCLSGVECGRLGDAKVLKYCVDASYVFFLAQFFTWPIVKAILSLLGGYESVFMPIRVILSLVICCLLAVIIHELMEKPLKRILNKRIK